ncbi:erythropoietin isoform X2 [Conger conger]|uniref:erythropoietin isoform X2 n=1 Tax=Conger conger TaxID=82655 RepID=UPI002A5A7575|nr:erythropoietin isoform X2 [Conger conger]
MEMSSSKDQKPDALSKPFDPPELEEIREPILSSSRVVAPVHWGIEAIIRKAQQRGADPGLIAVLLMVLEWTRPGLPSPLRPICDPRVLDHFIKEARDTEAAMRACREGCGIAEPLTLPLTSVDFSVWEKKNVQEQAREVQAGLSLLGQAISAVRASVTNSALHSLIESSYNNIRSIGQVLTSLNIQEVTSSPGGSEDTWRVSTMSELFRVHTNFLRGKVRLLLSSAPACNQDSS